MTAQKVVSLRPSDMVQGGLIDDVDVTVNESVFTLFDYQGKADPRVALKWILEDEEGNLHEQFWTAADPRHFVPSSDGNFIVATGEKGALNKGSNYDLLMSSLVNAGFPEPELDKGAAAMAGLKVHVLRKPAPKRSGIIRQEGEREQTVLTVSKLIAMPGEGKKAGKTVGSKPTAAPSGKTSSKSAKAEEVSSNGFDEELQRLVLEALSENDGTIEKRALVPFVFRKASGANKKAMVKRVAEDDFLIAGMAEGLWGYEDDTVTAA